MQTFVNLDPDVKALLRREVSDRNLEFDRVLNEAVRAALSSDAKGNDLRFVQKTYPLGSRVDLIKALALSDELGDDEVVRKMRLAEGRE